MRDIVSQVCLGYVVAISSQVHHFGPIQKRSTAQLCPIMKSRLENG
jgi:hypothetical protein